MSPNRKTDSSLPLLKCDILQITSCGCKKFVCINRWLGLPAIWLNNLCKGCSTCFEMFTILFRGAHCMIMSSKDDMKSLIMKIFKIGLRKGYLQSCLTGVNLYRPISGLLFAIHGNLQNKWLRFCKMEQQSI